MKAAVIFCEGGPSCIHASLTTILSASPSCPTVGTRPKAQTHARPGRTNSRQSRFITPLLFLLTKVPARVRRRHAGGGLRSYLAGSRALVTPRAIFKVSVRRFAAPVAGSTLADASHVCPLSSVSFQRLTFESPPF